MKQGQNAIFRRERDNQKTNKNSWELELKIAKAINSTENSEDKIEELATKGNSIENGRES